MSEVAKLRTQHMALFTSYLGEPFSLIRYGEWRVCNRVQSLWWVSLPLSIAFVSGACQWCGRQVISGFVTRFALHFTVRKFRPYLWAPKRQ